MMLQTLEVPMFCTPLKGIGNFFPHGWGPQGRVSAITSKRLESSERGTKGRPPEAVPGKFGPRDTGTCRNIATSPWISPSWIWNWWHLFRASSLLLRQIQTWARARVQLYTLAAQDLRIFALLAIKAAVGELSVLGCRAPQPREGNLATCQGLEHVNNFKTLIDLYVCWISSGYLQLLSVPIFRYWTALLKTYFHSILLLFPTWGECKSTGNVHPYVRILAERTWKGGCHLTSLVTTGRTIRRRRSQWCIGFICFTLKHLSNSPLNWYGI